MAGEGTERYALKTLGGEVGLSTLRLLKKAGYKDIRDLASSKSEELQDIKGIGEKVANTILEAARAKVVEFGKWVNGLEIYQREEAQGCLSTGCKELDRILGGGFRPGTMTQIVAGFGMGKTQLCFQMAIQASLAPEEGGLGKKTAWIDTEGRFNGHRVAQLAKARGIEPNAALKRIYVSRAYNSEHQKNLVQEALAKVEELDLGLIVVDSVMAHFQAEYIGRGQYQARQGSLAEHLAKMKRAIRMKNLVGLITNRMNEDLDVLFGDPLVPVGGEIVGCASDLILLIKRGKNGTRKCKVTKASGLPMEEIQLQFTDAGFSNSS